MEKMEDGELESDAGSGFHYTPLERMYAASGPTGCVSLLYVHDNRILLLLHKWFWK